MDDRERAQQEPQDTCESFTLVIVLAPTLASTTLKPQRTCAYWTPTNQPRAARPSLDSGRPGPASRRASRGPPRPWARPSARPRARATRRPRRARPTCPRSPPPPPTDAARHVFFTPRWFPRGDQRGCRRVTGVLLERHTLESDGVLETRAVGPFDAVSSQTRVGSLSLSLSLSRKKRSRHDSTSFSLSLSRPLLSLSIHSFH